MRNNVKSVSETLKIIHIHPMECSCKKNKLYIMTCSDHQNILLNEKQTKMSQKKKITD